MDTQDCAPKLLKASDDDPFDEIEGRFCSASPNGDDSFEIVFSDAPSTSRARKPSESSSEDSFIVFESTDACYTSKDVFGEESEEESDCSESESENSDTCGVEHENEIDFDEVDCAFRSAEVIPEENVQVLSDIKEENEPESLEDDKRKKKTGPIKKVTFSPQPPKVRVMRVWSFAARQARMGHWERHALDRERFKRRIADVDRAVSWVFNYQHRCNMLLKWYMPWWNSQSNDQAEIEEKRSEGEDLQINTEVQAKGDCVNKEKLFLGRSPWSLADVCAMESDG